MDQVRPEDIRISDAERGAAQEQLRLAHEAGRLDLLEFDERTRAVWTARTRADLARVTADVPPPPRPPARPPLFADSGAGTTMRVLTALWAAASAVNLAVWALLTVFSGEFEHPWWLWVALPPGAVLAVLHLLGIGRPRTG